MISSTRTRLAAGGVAAVAGAVLLLSGCAGTDGPAAPVDSVAVPGIAPAADAQRLETAGHVGDGADDHLDGDHFDDGPLGDDRLRQLPLGDDADDRFGDDDDRFGDDADDRFDDDDLDDDRLDDDDDDGGDDD